MRVTQEGVKDVVKANVAQLLQEVAKTVDPELLAVLVAKVPQADIASAVDAQAVFSLLMSICQNQKVENWADLVYQCLGIGWDLLLSPSATAFVITSPEEKRSSSASGALASAQENLLAWLVISADEEWRGKGVDEAQWSQPPFVSHCIQKCLDQIVDGVGLFESLHTLLRLIRGIHKVRIFPLHLLPTAKPYVLLERYYLMQMYFALSDSDISEIMYIGNFPGTSNRFSSVLRSDVSEFDLSCSSGNGPFQYSEVHLYINYFNTKLFDYYIVAGFSDESAVIHAVFAARAVQILPQ